MDEAHFHMWKWGLKKIIFITLSQLAMVKLSFKIPGLLTLKYMLLVCHIVSVFRVVRSLSATHMGSR